MEIRWCIDSWVNCDGECWNCFVKNATFSDKTNIRSITYSNNTEEKKEENNEINRKGENGGVVL